MSKIKKSVNGIYKFTDINVWSESYLAEAQADEFKEIDRHIDYLSLNVRAKKFVDASLLLVDFGCSSIQGKGLSAVEFLNQQKYRLSGYEQPLYCVTIEITPTHCGRIVCDHRFSRIDLVDLHLQVWFKYQAEGFQRMFISRIDGQEIDQDEMQRIKGVIEEDFHYDYDPKDIHLELEYFDELCPDTIVFTVSS